MVSEICDFMGVEMLEIHTFCGFLGAFSAWSCEPNGGAEFPSLLLLERCEIRGEYTCNFAKMDNFRVCHRHTGGLN